MEIDNQTIIFALGAGILGIILFQNLIVSMLMVLTGWELDMLFKLGDVGK